MISLCAFAAAVFLFPCRFTNGAACLGSTYYKDCSEAGHSSICKGIGGCTWEGDPLWGYCQGAVIPCEGFNDDVRGCNNQLGCKYSWDPPNPDEDFITAITPLGTDLECIWDWDGFPIVCEKCQDSADGNVCYTEVTMNPISTLCFMTIDGANCKSCQMCGTGHHMATFDCGNIVEGEVIGLDCDGERILG
eukprot:CCRYP_004163-RA/>CCRYP_004163-RA protein AED:0.29 eAED:0.29 QI:0/-1/0/1/-1/1/1/0/190